MEVNPTLTFLSGVPPAEVPITDLTVNDIRLVCIAGTFDGTVIYPDNIITPIFTHLGNGQYNIGWFNGGCFKPALTDKLYEVKVQRKIGGDWTDQYQFGTFYIGDLSENFNLKANDNAVLKLAGGTMTGNIVLAGAPSLDLHPASKKYVDDNAGLCLKPTGDFIKTAGNTVFNPATFVNINGYGACRDPESDNEMVNLKTLNAAITGIVNIPFQESVNKRRVWIGATYKVNQVYAIMLDAVNSFTNDSKEKLIELLPGSDYRIHAKANSLLNRNYISFVGASPAVELIVYDGTVNKNLIFKDLILWFSNENPNGIGNSTGARAYTNIKYVNCIIYAFEDTRYSSCILDNCILIHTSGKKATIDGYSILKNTIFNNEAVISDDVVKVYSDSNLSDAIINYRGAIGVMPDDPLEIPS